MRAILTSLAVQFKLIPNLTAGLVLGGQVTLAILALTAFLNAGIAREVEPGKILLPAPWRLEIIATDISRQALKIANNAIYVHRKERLNSFRQIPDYAMRFFDRMEQSVAGEMVYKVKSSVKKLVRFEWFNLKNNVPLFTNVDVAFCRNVLIYIDVKEHANVQNMLGRSLNRQGCLFLGLVDTLSEFSGLKVNHKYMCGFYEKA